MTVPDNAPVDDDEDGGDDDEEAPNDDEDPREVDAEEAAPLDGITLAEPLSPDGAPDDDDDADDGDGPGAQRWLCASQWPGAQSPSLRQRDEGSSAQPDHVIIRTSITRIGAQRTIAEWCGQTDFPSSFATRVRRNAASSGIPAAAAFSITSWRS